MGILTTLGYVNPLTTSLSFDVSLVVPNPAFITPAPPIYGVAAGQTATVRFQNNIQSIFSRVRLLYGANPLEDMINYNVIVRNLTEWTAGNPSLSIDQGTICDGIGNNTMIFQQNSQTALSNTRANLIHGCCFGRDGTADPDIGVGRGAVGASGAGSFPSGVLTASTLAWTDGTTASTVPTIIVTRRYQVQLALGLMTQEKLIPTKYMASQLAIELTLVLCIFLTLGNSCKLYCCRYCQCACSNWQWSGIYQWMAVCTYLLCQQC